MWQPLIERQDTFRGAFSALALVETGPLRLAPALPCGDSNETSAPHLGALHRELGP